MNEDERKSGEPPAARPRSEVPPTDFTIGATSSNETINITVAGLGSFGGYELLEELGRGGMGVVYKAREKKLKRLVALKMIHGGAQARAEDLARFVAEVETVAALQHPNIVQIHETGNEAGRVYAALEYVEGGSLEKKLSDGPLPARQAAQIVEILARAADAAHAQGIVHRDLKPANVLLSKCDARHGISFVSRRGSAHFEPKITDFGLVKLLKQESSQTKSGSVVGTPSYMSPEQASGKSREIGPATDTYALGAILYELLTGRPPFRADTPYDTMVQVVSELPVPPTRLQPKTPRDLETICLKCLEKEPRKRYESAADLSEDLGRFLESRPIVARPVGVLGHTWRWCQRFPALAALIAVSLVALLLLVGIGAWFTRQLSRELQQTEEAKRSLQMALSRQVAERIEGDLQRVSAAPRAVAASLAERTDWTDDQINRWIRSMVEHDSEIFGMCVAFEPREFSPDVEDYAPYAYREANRIVSKQLLPPEYPLYRNWDWYRIPVAEQHPTWGEPYLDTGGGNIPMITFSAPIRRGDRIAGVVTADLSIEYFRVLRHWLDELHFSPGSHGFVLSRAGMFVSHPDERFQMPVNIWELPAIVGDDQYAALKLSLERGESGTMRLIDFSSGQPANFLYAPIPSSGGYFVAVVPDE